MKPMIEVQNLTKYYGPVLAVNDISFTVPEGSIVGFLGPNGAGKSTTLKILTCFLAASGGRAYVDGFNVMTQSYQVRQRIGYLPENVPMYPDMKVRDYLRFRAQLKGIPRRQRAVAIAKAAERCWLTHPTDVTGRRIDQLSKGYRQRVGLADAVMHEPAVLVLDEPTVGLDPTQIRETRNLIAELGQHHTIILSSHILPEVEQTCQQILIIAGGQIIATGAPAELRQRVSGGSRIFCEVRGPDIGPLVKKMAATPGVRQAVVVGQQGDWSRLAVTPGDGQDPTVALVEAIQQSGFDLREIRRETASLEDFFVQVTAQQHQARGAAVAV